MVGDFRENVVELGDLRVPDFLVVGAPKCGTTSMNFYLSQHPQIFIPPKKELHYFGTDLHWRQDRKSREQYFEYFSDAQKDQTAGEASVYYLFSRQAAQEIKACNPNCRIICMLRDPMEMLPSFHSQLLRTGNEFLFDLNDALDAEVDRRAGKRLPPELNPGMNQGLFYSEIAKYSIQLRRYIKFFGRHRIHVILYDDFEADPAKVYGEVLQFLGVESFEPDFQRLNANRRIVRPMLWRVARFPSARLRGIWRAMLPENVRRRILRRLARAYTIQGKREELSLRIRARIREMYVDEVEELGNLLGRDLGHWLDEGV